MQKLRYKDFEIENEDKSLLAKMFIDAVGKLYAAQQNILELHKTICKKETELVNKILFNEEQARELLNIGRDAFKNILASEKHKKPKFITNAKNMKFFHIDDLVDYAQYIFSEEFSHNEYFMNPEFYEKKGVDSAHKNFGRYSKIKEK